MNRKFIKCNTVQYRKGFIEVSGNIHPDCVNIEVWNIHPDIEISDIDLDNDSLPDKAVTANTEIELTLKNAEDLVQQLEEAINIAYEKSDT